jgi:hypothetical protein
LLASWLPDVVRNLVRAKSPKGPAEVHTTSV